MNYNRELQGIYQRQDGAYFYLSWCPGDDHFYTDRILPNSKIGTYSTMTKLRNINYFFVVTKRIYLTHLIPDTVVSDIYPELFI